MTDAARVVVRVSFGYTESGVASGAARANSFCEFLTREHYEMLSAHLGGTAWTTVEYRQELRNGGGAEGDVTNYWMYDDDADDDPDACLHHYKQCSVMTADTQLYANKLGGGAATPYVPRVTIERRTTIPHPHPPPPLACARTRIECLTCFQQLAVDDEGAATILPRTFGVRATLMRIDGGARHVLELLLTTTESGGGGGDDGLPLAHQYEKLFTSRHVIEQAMAFVDAAMVRPILSAIHAHDCSRNLFERMSLVNSHVERTAVFAMCGASATSAPTYPGRARLAGGALRRRSDARGALETRRYDVVPHIARAEHVYVLYAFEAPSAAGAKRKRTDDGAAAHVYVIAERAPSQVWRVHDDHPFATLGVRRAAPAGATRAWLDGDLFVCAFDGAVACAVVDIGTDRGVAPPGSALHALIAAHALDARVALATRAPSVAACRSAIDDECGVYASDGLMFVPGGADKENAAPPTIMWLPERVGTIGMRMRYNALQRHVEFWAAAEVNGHLQDVVVCDERRVLKEDMAYMNMLTGYEYARQRRASGRLPAAGAVCEMRFDATNGYYRFKCMRKTTTRLGDGTSYVMPDRVSDIVTATAALAEHITLDDVQQWHARGT